MPEFCSVHKSFRHLAIANEKRIISGALDDVIATLKEKVSKHTETRQRHQISNDRTNIKLLIIMTYLFICK